MGESIVGSDLLEQIERELAAVTERHPLPWTWWKCGGYDRLASGIQSDDFEFPVHGSIMDDGSGCGEYNHEIDPDGVYGVFFANAPAHIRAMLPVVRAALAFEETQAVYTSIKNSECPVSDKAIALWIAKLNHAETQYENARKGLIMAVHAFKEGQQYDHN